MEEIFMSMTRSGRSLAGLTALVLVAALPSGVAQAQKTSTPAKAKPAAKAAPKAKKGLMTSLEAYQKAKAIALKWQRDAELTDLSSLSTSPVGLDGRSAEWNIHFMSKGADKTNLMSVKDGVVTPYEVKGGQGEVIEVVEGTIMDSAKLIQIAQENGGSSFPGSKITIGVVQNRNGPLWHVSYSDAEGNELLHLAIEGNGGKATQL
jgi:hypothetical protein